MKSSPGWWAVRDCVIVRRWCSSPPFLTVCESASNEVNLFCNLTLFTEQYPANWTHRPPRRLSSTISLATNSKFPFQKSKDNGNERPTGSLEGPSGYSFCALKLCVQQLIRTLQSLELCESLEFVRNCETPRRVAITFSRLRFLIESMTQTNI